MEDIVAHPPTEQNLNVAEDKMDPSTKPQANEYNTNDVEQNAMPQTEIAVGEQKACHSCSLCGVELQSLPELTKHLIAHSVNAHCSLCVKGFDEPSLLEKHLTTHGGETPEDHMYPDVTHASADTGDRCCMCVICNKVFANHSLLNVHVKSHTKTHKCGICGKRFGQVGELREHAQSHGIPDSNTLSLYKCTTCGKEYKYNARRAFRRHLASHTKPHKCLICNKRYGSTYHLHRHMRTHGIQPVHLRNHTKKPETADAPERSSVSTTVDGRYKCDICLKEYDKRFAVIRHIMSHTKPYKCSVCGEGFGQSVQVKNHMKKHETNDGTSEISPKNIKGHRSAATGKGSHKCDTCDKEYATRGMLTMHMKIHNKTCMCALCGKMFAHPYHLRAHEMTHQEPDLSSKKYNCEICSKKFTTRALLSMHLKIHSKPHLCSVCGKRFAYLYKLRKHQCHKQYKNRKSADLTTCTQRHSCSLCDKSFTQSAELNMLAHDGTHSLYKCTTCGKEYNTGRALRKHLTSHTKPHKCSLCDKRFGGTYQLHRHMITHTGEKPFMCSVCGKGFNRMTTLTTHSRLHTGEKPYKCSHCDAEFAQLAALTQHTKKHTQRADMAEESHNGVNGSTSDKCCMTKSTKKRQKRTTRNSHKCSVYNTRFKQLQTLEEHMMTHEEEKLEKTDHTVTEMQLGGHGTDKKACTVEKPSDVLVGSFMEFMQNGDEESRKVKQKEKKQLKPSLNMKRSQAPRGEIYWHSSSENSDVEDEMDSLWTPQNDDNCSISDESEANYHSGHCQAPRVEPTEHLQAPTEEAYSSSDNSDTEVDKMDSFGLNEEMDSFGLPQNNEANSTREHMQAPRVEANPPTEHIQAPRVQADSPEDIQAPGVEANSPTEHIQAPRVQADSPTEHIQAPRVEADFSPDINSDTEVDDMDLLGLNEEMGSIRTPQNNETNSPTEHIQAPRVEAYSSDNSDMEVDEMHSLVPNESMDSLWTPQNNDTNSSTKHIQAPRVEATSPTEHIQALRVEAYFSSDNSDTEVDDMDSVGLKEEIDSSGSPQNNEASSATEHIQAPRVEANSPTHHIQAPRVQADSPNEHIQTPRVEANSPTEHIQAPRVGADSPTEQSPDVKEEMDGAGMNDGMGSAGMPQNKKDCSTSDETYKIRQQNKAPEVARNVARKTSYKCETCDKKFITHSLLNVHIKIHTRPYKCSVCGKGFGQLAQLKQHEKKHETPDLTTSIERHQCSVCDKSFSRSNALKEHMLVHNATGSLYVCSTCGKEYNVQRSFRKHVASHTKPHKCSLCDKRFGSTSHLHNHMRTHTGEKPFMCSVCGKGFSRMTTLTTHSRLHTGEKPYKCSHCDAKFAAVGGLHIHIKTHTDTVHDGDPISCKLCGKKFKIASSLKYHMMIHKGENPHKCHICGERFKKAAQVRNHMRVHTGENRYSCTICHKGYYFASALKYHMTKHTGYTCDICNEGFKAATALRVHKKTHTGENPQKLSANDEDFKELSTSQIDTKANTACVKDEKPYSCKLCVKRFKIASSLKYHMMIHTGENPYECDNCDERFKKAAQLRNHMRVHTGKNPYTCKICHKGFYFASSLKYHMTKHTGEAPFTCDICNEGFKTATTLRVHKKTHTAENPKKVSASDEDFKEPSTLQIDLKADAGCAKDEKPYSCKLCDKRYKTASSLKYHMMIHTGKTPHKCNICSKGFKTAASVRNHMRVHTGEDRYKCDICQKGFYFPSALKYHMTKHTGEDPFSCNICNEGFKVAADLRVHTCSQLIEAAKEGVDSAAEPNSDVGRRHGRRRNRRREASQRFSE